MKTYEVHVHPSSERLPRERQLAWKIAELAAYAPARPDDAVAEMIACRVIDNAGVALASVNRRPVVAARAMALGHRRSGGGTLYGMAPSVKVDAEWAAWANATAVRELDFHDTFLAADYAHPGDCISPILAVAQQVGKSGRDVMRAIAVSYEVHVALVKAICLHKHKKDHVAHLCPATVAGIGALLSLPTEVIFQAVNLAVHLSFSTRQSRKGEISSWKAYVPGFSGKLAIEAVDRSMRGEAAPSPIYEGEDSVIAWMLDGPNASYTVSLPEKGEPLRGILETYTKAHSAEYQAQAFIDLSIELSERIPDLAEIDEIVVETSHHTHHVIGTGAKDPQKLDPDASRETLDHSLMFIIAVALEDRQWHHERSYTAERTHRPSTVALWRKIRTLENREWTARYHESDPVRRAFGGAMRIILRDGSVVSGEKAVADAHPNGARPWGFDDYVGKFAALARDLVGDQGMEALVSAARKLGQLPPEDLAHLVPALKEGNAIDLGRSRPGIFDHRSR